MDSTDSTRAAIEEHWRASEDGDTETEHAIYAADAILDYPHAVNASKAARRLRRNGVGTRPIGTSRCCGSSAQGICG